MRIDYLSLSEEDFDVIQRDNKILIRPTKSKHVWKEEEKWYRSVLCNEAGEVLSIGFPKFLNYHEDVELHETALREAQEIHIYPKLDGSLILMSFNGDKHEPIIRTRGCHDMGELQHVEKFILERYGRNIRQLNREVRGITLLFEYTGPDQQIVIPYQEQSITLIGMVRHGLHAPWLMYQPERLANLAMKWEFRSVKPIKIPGETFHDKMEHVATQENTEGVVAAAFGLIGNPRLIKVKSKWYIRLHGLRTAASQKKINELLGVLYITEAVENKLLARDVLFRQGIDFETLDFVNDYMEEFYAQLEKNQRILDRLRQATSTWVNLDRKSYVTKVKQFQAEQEYPSWVFQVAMSIYDQNSMAVTCGLLSATTGESPRTIQNHWWNSSPEEILGGKS